MHQRSVVRVGASLLIASLALSACGSRGGTNTAGSGDKKIAKIGIMAPLSGDLSALGLGIQHSVELAVKQANESNAIPGWTLQVEAKDDEAKPDVGKNAATAFAGEANVAGVVGNLNSSVAQSTQPVLATAKIVQVSPANTNPTLTQGADFKTAPKRTYDTYFRTCTTDAVQGPFAARYLFEKAGFIECRKYFEIKPTHIKDYDDTVKKADFANNKIQFNTKHPKPTKLYESAVELHNKIVSNDEALAQWFDRAVNEVTADTVGIARLVTSRSEFKRTVGNAGAVSKDAIKRIVLTDALNRIELKEMAFAESDDGKKLKSMLDKLKCED